MHFPSVVDVMSGAGDAAGRDRERGGEEEELASSEDGAAMPEEGGTAATAPRDAHVAAITFVGALKIPVNISDLTSMWLRNWKEGVIGL